MNNHHSIQKHNPEAEEHYIQAVLLHGQDEEYVSLLIDAIPDVDYFSTAKCRDIVTAIHDLYAEGIMPSETQITTRLREIGRPSRADDVSDLAQYSPTYISISDALASTDLIRASYTKRTILDTIIGPRFQKLANANGNISDVLEEFKDAVDKAIVLNNVEGHGTSVFDILDFHQMSQLPDISWLQKPLLSPRSTMMIAAEPTMGKTFIVLCWIVHACTGAPWADTFSFSRPLRVLYCTNEGISGIKGRLLEAIEQNEADTRLIRENLRFSRTVPQLFDDNHPQNAKKFVAQIRSMDFEPDIIWIDTLINASAGANLNADWSKINDTVNYIKAALTCSVGLVHHKSTKNDNGPMGLSYMVGNMDTIIELNRKGNDGRVMKFTKTKDDKEPNNIEYTIQANHSRAYVVYGNAAALANAAGEALTDMQSEILTLLNERRGEWLTAKDIIEITNQTKSKVDAALRGLRAIGAGIKAQGIDHTKAVSSKNPWRYCIPNIH